MSKYESKFRKDMNRLLYIWTELDKIEKQYEEVIMSLRQSAVIPDHLMFNTKTLVELGSFMTEDGNPDKWGEEDDWEDEDEF